MNVSSKYQLKSVVHSTTTQRNDSDARGIVKGYGTQWEYKV